MRPKTEDSVRAIQSHLKRQPRFSKSRDSDVNALGRLVDFILRIRPAWLGMIVAFIVAPFWFCLMLAIAIFRALGIVLRGLAKIFVRCGDILTDRIFPSHH